MTSFLSMFAFIGLIAAQFSAVIAVSRARLDDSEKPKAEKPVVRGDVRAWNDWLMH